MPEGDSVHRIALLLQEKLAGRELAVLSLPRSGTRTEGLIGSKVASVEARGKNLLVHFEATSADESATRKLSLHVHLKMNGRVRVYERASAPAIAMNHASAIVETAQHRVVVYDAPIARLVRTHDLLADFHFRGLGPDVLAPRFELEEALRRLKARAALPLGEALLDQSVLAGLGNVWKSELCFTLRFDPFAPVARYTDEELSALLALARAQLVDNVHGPARRLPDPFVKRAQRRARVNPRQGEGALSVYERAGEPCYDCGGLIAMQRQGEQLRSTYFCARCQPARGAP